MLVKWKLNATDSSLKKGPIKIYVKLRHKNTNDLHQLLQVKKVKS